MEHDPDGPDWGPVHPADDPGAPVPQEPTYDEPVPVPMQDDPPPPALAAALEAELRARSTPPHQDGQYREGIAAGLALAWRIATDTPDADYVNWDGDRNRTSVYPSARMAGHAADPRPYHDGSSLGLATTAQLLDELRSRITVDHAQGGGGLGYTTVHGRPSSPYGADHHFPGGGRPCTYCGEDPGTSSGAWCVPHDENLHAPLDAVEVRRPAPPYPPETGTLDRTGH